jgi:predicted MFS family arabinose efflux permease
MNVMNIEEICKIFLFFCFSGILRQVQDEYQIEDGQAGALQTAFVISYMLFAPLFGYFGDRYSRYVRGSL